MSNYRVICSRAPDWNRVPVNRFSRPAAEKLVIKFNSYCPGEHTIEEIKDESQQEKAAVASQPENDR